MALTAWRAYVEVCRLGSISAAAAELGYTQSAVSRQIAGLEREIGAQLLRREIRGVTPTPEGEAFLRHARVIVHEADRAARAVRAARESVPALRLGATPSLAAGIVPAAVRELIGADGTLSWMLRPGLSAELAERLLADELDLAVVTDAPPGLPEDPRLVHAPLGQDEMAVVVPAGHRLARRRRVSLRALADAVWVEDNAGSATLLRQHAARAGFAARIDLDAADLPGKLAMVATGHAVALVPGALTRALRPDVAVVRLDQPPRRGIHALTQRGNTHPATATLIPILRSELAHLVPQPRRSA
jgi:DNA-binding transcriptional LysR family regulator